MRDTNKKIMFIMWAVVAVFLVVILTTRKVTFKERSFDDSDEGFSFSIGSSSSQVIPAAAEDFNKVYTFAGRDFKNIDITLVGGDVILESTDGNEIVVALNGTAWHMENEPVVTFEGRKLSVKTPEEAEVNKWYQGYRKVTVKIPASLLNTFFDAAIETVSGNIWLRGIMYDSLDADSVSGDIEATGTFRSAECNSISGNVEFETETPLTGNSSFISVSGDICLTLPEDSSFDMEWETLSGSVRNDFVDGGCRKKGSSRVGSGKPDIALEAVSGDIRVTKI